jgi:prepilin peptidase CpaA
MYRRHARDPHAVNKQPTVTPPPRFFYRITMLERDFLIGAAVLASLGGASDARTTRIPNWLTYSGLATALVLRFAVLGWEGFKSGAAGTLIAGVLFLFLFVIGAMGGGDVKLTASVGAWAGSTQVVPVLMAAGLAGGLLAILYMIYSRAIRRTLWNVLDLIRFRLTSGLQPHPWLSVREMGTLRVPFGVAIAMGTLFCAGDAIWWR